VARAGRGARLHASRALDARTRRAARWPADAAVLLLDTLGELAGLYAGARLAFVGGTLVPVGGTTCSSPPRRHGGRRRPRTANVAATSRAVARGRRRRGHDGEALARGSATLVLDAARADRGGPQAASRERAEGRSPSRSRSSAARSPRRRERRGRDERRGRARRAPLGRDRLRAPRRRVLLAPAAGSTRPGSASGTRPTASACSAAAPRRAAR
jgi:hypothetical protein